MTFFRIPQFLILRVVWISPMDEHHIFPEDEIAPLLEEMGISHVVWVPDSTLGLWESALLGSPIIQLISVCREGEAWAVAAGLHLGGRKPLVVIQCTGFFESGDALRNVLHDYKLPLYGLIGRAEWTRR